MRTFLRAVVIAATPLAIWFPSVAMGQSRIWRDSTGTHSVEAEYVGSQNNVVQLRRADGKVIGVPIAKLSPADNAFIGAVAAQAQVATWETVSVPGICTYQIPPTVELQKGSYKIANDLLRKSWLRIDPSLDRVVAQPRGTNDFDDSALGRYCRIIVETTRGAKGDYPKLDELPVPSTTELREIDEAFKKQLEQEFTVSASVGMKMTLLSWQSVKIARVNGVNVIQTTYTRSVKDGPSALVRVYAIPNNDAMHRITISYRESEEKLWKEDLNKVIGTFKFKKR